MSKFQNTFTFRKIKKSDLEQLVQNVDAPEAEVRAQFDVSEDGASARRKPVTVDLEVPAFAESLPETARDVIMAFVGQFVKATYIDNFVAVGAHDWATIEADMANRSRGGRRAAFDITDEVMKAAAASIEAFVTAGTGKKVVGEKFSKAVVGKFSKSAIQRNIGDVTEDVLDKLASWLERWVEHVGQTEPDTLEEYSDVFSMLVSKIDSHRESDLGSVADAL